MPKEKKEKAPPPDEDTQPLTQPLMDLSDLGRTVEGGASAFRAVSSVDKKLTSIKALASFPHLRSIDLSRNAIKDVAPLKGLKHVVRLALADNLVKDLKAWEAEEDEPPFPYLVHLDLSGNALPALLPLPMSSLKTLNLARNEIGTCEEFTGHETLQALDLSDQRTTKIKSLAGVAAMPSLTKLDVSGNELQDIEGLADLPALKDLSLAKNPLKELQGPWQDLAELAALSLRGCQLEAVQPLEALRSCPLLRTLEVQGNPFCKALDDRARTEVLICHWRLSSLDGKEVAEEELEAARKLNVEREEERRRQQAEAEAAAGEEGES